MVKDPQQIADAELRLAFEQVLPRRVAALRRRLTALAQNGWDINLLRVLHLETGQLAGTAGRYGLVDASELLATLEKALGRSVQAGLLPTERQAHAISDQLERLDELSGTTAQQPTSTMARSRDVTRPPRSDPEVELNGLPAAANISKFVHPPLDFLPFDQIPVSLFTGQSSALPEPHPSSADTGDTDLQFLEQTESVQPGDMSGDLVTGSDVYDVFEAEDSTRQWAQDLTLITAEQPAVPEHDDRDGDSTQATPAESPELDRKLLYYLAQHRPVVLLNQLDPYYEVEYFDSPSEFVEILKAVSPEALLIGGDQLDALSEIQPILEKARKHKQGKPLPFFVVADSDQIEHRLSALRAGADAFLQADTTPEEIRRRLDEVLANNTDQAFRILVLEDDQSQSLLTSRILQKAGMKVVVQPEPLKIMSSLESHDPDLILMDLYMPGCDGMELTTIIREHPRFLHTPIVFLSGESDTDKHFDALLAGGDDFLAKPVRPKHLISAVANRIRRSRALAARQRREPSKQDETTGLYQRVHVMEQINAALISAPTEPGDNGGVLFAELNDQHKLKVQFGVNGLETLSQQIGSVLSARLQPQDLICRYADSVFVILLPGRDLNELMQLGEQTTRALATAQIGIAEQPVKCSLAIGICGLSRQFGDASAIVAAAERTAVNARNSGKAVAIHRLQTSGLRKARDPGADREIEQALRQALKQNQLQVVYQPIVSLHGDEAERYQSLARLPIESQRQVLPAAQFIGVAERAKIVAHIDRQMLARAIAVLDRRRRSGRKTELFVSQSAQLKQDPKRLSWLDQLLKLRQITPRALVLEFAADALLKEPDSVTTVTELRQLSVGLSIAGVCDTKSHWGLIEALNPTYVKVASAGSESANAAIQQFVTRLHAENLKVIMPTVEDARTAASLWTYGIDFIQGNFVQQPEPKLAYQFAGN